MVRAKADNPNLPLEELPETEQQPTADAINTNGSTIAATKSDPASEIDPDIIDNIFKELKTLLTTVEKLQKARQEVGDIKPLVLRLLDGEQLSGEQLEELKSGLTGLSKLVRLHSDYQTALENAQPARGLLDQVLKT